MRYQFKLQCWLRARFSVALVILLVALGTNCTSGNQFPGGIRITTSEALVMLPFATTPVPNVFVGGNMQGTPGTPTRGTEIVISGTTNAQGIRDFPNAVTNATWRVEAGPSVSPPCAAGSDTKHVPLDGAIFDFVCLL